MSSGKVLFEWSHWNYTQGEGDRLWKSSKRFNNSKAFSQLVNVGCLIVTLHHR